MISKMQAEHLAQVKALLDACFGLSAWSAEAIFSQLNKPESSCTVAVKDDRVIGYLAFEQILDEGSIIEIAVDPNYRRQGIARELILSSLSKAENLTTVFLEVRESNISALSLYRSLGFVAVSTRRDYYDNPKENAVIMCLEVK